MKTMDIKAELQQLIENENDVSILESLRILLKKTRLDRTLKDTLTNRSEESEIDIAAGKVINKDEILRRLSA